LRLVHQIANDRARSLSHRDDVVAASRMNVLVVVRETQSRRGDG
jgi:hypothetical protein